VNLWQELRRRRVFRLTGLYVVGAWLVIQVADIWFPAWGLPETALRFLFIAAIACFPVALIFGWFYDITPQGIVRTEPSGDRESVDLRLKPVDYVVLAALLAIGSAIVIGSIGKIQEEIETGSGVAAPVEKTAHSIAVLPFSNLDTNPDTGFFSDGITEEILHRLSTLGALHVLASTSSFAFRDSEESPASISDKLGVRYLLQGSVRRDGDHVRITARLLDEDGFQLWSDRFDRRLESIFVIQAEIASRVSSEIVNRIVPPQELPAGRTTENMEAYNAYLRGRAYFDSRTPSWKDRAGEAFNKAIELDPDFAPPYAGLATLVVNSARGPHWEEARGFAEKALQLDPDLPLGHATLGLTRAVLGEPERGAESLRKAIELDRSLAIAYTWILMPLRELGLHDEAVAMQERGLEIDPLNPVLIRNSVGIESSRGNFQRAEHLALRMTGLPEPPFWTFGLLYELYVDWGRYADAIDAAKTHMRYFGPDSDYLHADALASAYAALGLVEDAEYWFETFRSQWDEKGPPLAETYYFAAQGAGLRWLSADLEKAASLIDSEGPYDAPYLLSYGGLAWIQAGNAQKGVEWLERGIGFYQNEMVADDPPDAIDFPLLERRWPTPVVVHLAQRLAFAYRVTETSRGVEEAMDFLEKDRANVQLPTDPVTLESIALTSVLSGDADTALRYLRQALELGWANYYGIVNDPAWAETIQTPEFQTLLAEAKANNDRQRAIVEVTDAENDFRAEFEKMTSSPSE
jgi:TolB-like protein